MKSNGYIYFVLRKSSWRWVPKYRSNVAGHGWALWWLGFYIGGGI